MYLRAFVFVFFCIFMTRVQPGGPKAAFLLPNNDIIPPNPHLHHCGHHQIIIFAHITLVVSGKSLWFPLMIAKRPETWKFWTINVNFNKLVKTKTESPYPQVQPPVRRGDGDEGEHLVHVEHLRLFERWSPDHLLHQLWICITSILQQQQYGWESYFRIQTKLEICTNTNASTSKQHTASARHSRCFKILRGDSQLNLIMFVSSYLNTLEICQKLYMTEFYTLKVRKLRLFLLKKKQRKCINISYFSNFFVKI